ncbi:MAG: TonB family protein [Taibaiella sp.]|nr:TonB family protein [Taibaiella sp.]
MRGRAHIRYNYQTEDLETLFFNYFELNSIWNGRMVAYNRQGKIILEAYFLDNVPERTWKVYKDDGTPNYDLTFKNGKLVEYTDHIHNTKDNIGNNKPRQPLVGAGDPQGIDPGVTQPTPPSVFTYVEQMPSPPYDLNNYLSKTIKYPEEAQKSAIDGRVIIKFVVNEDGSISNAEVIRTLDPYCDKEAIRVINNMPIWKPGKQNGKAVKVYFTLPITFRLVQEEMKK